MREDAGVITADSLARFAAVLADRSRAGICLALLDGRAWTAGELAQHVGIARSTASEHLTTLVAAGLLAEQRQGRHRYLRLAGPEIAQLVEDLAAAVGVPGRPSSLRAARVSHQLAAARTCYDHLAGALGVGLFDALVDAELIDTSSGLVLTPAGRTWFADLAGAQALHPRGTRPLLRSCLPPRRHPRRRPVPTAAATVLAHPNPAAPRSHPHPRRLTSTDQPARPRPTRTTRKRQLTKCRKSIVWRLSVAPRRSGSCRGIGGRHPLPLRRCAGLWNIADVCPIRLILGTPSRRTRLGEPEVPLY